METISTQHLDLLPNPADLQDTCKAIAVLEAIICPEYQNRQYTYTHNCMLQETLFQFRDDEGNCMHILFAPYGTVINGFAVDSAMNGWKEMQAEKAPGKCWFGLAPKTYWTQEIWPGVTNRLPACFHHFILENPVARAGTTFCVWQMNEDAHWRTGNVIFPEDEYKDGSADLLSILDGNPESYLYWATEYYDLENMDIDIVQMVYEQAPITPFMVAKLNAEYCNLKMLAADLTQMEYKHHICY